MKKINREVAKITVQYIWWPHMLSKINEYIFLNFETIKMNKSYWNNLKAENVVMLKSWDEVNND